MQIEYVWNMCIQYIKKTMYGVLYMEDVWNRVSHLYSIWGFSLVCDMKMEYVWNMYGISMEYTWNVYEIICME